MLSIGKLLTVEQRLSKALVAIMGSPKYTALAGVLMIGEKIVNDTPTACTNGRDEMYGREFVEGLTDAELRGLVLHENYHKLYQHMYVRVTTTTMTVVWMSMIGRALKILATRRRERWRVTLTRPYVREH
jgi:predicted metal-dependent peptidase